MTQVCSTQNYQPQRTHTTHARPQTRPKKSKRERARAKISLTHTLCPSPNSCCLPLSQATSANARAAASAASRKSRQRSLGEVGDVPMGVPMGRRGGVGGRLPEEERWMTAHHNMIFFIGLNLNTCRFLGKRQSRILW